MFTGIITDVGRIAAVEEASWGRRFRIATNYDVGDLAIGASIACSGPCLTVVARSEDDAAGTGNWFDVEATTETVSLTTVSDWSVGTPVNLERALRAGDEMGGHVVSGHVDGLAKIIARDDTKDEVGETAKFTIEVPDSLSRYIARKGSVALDGVSLTVNSVGGNRFTVMIIPHTLSATALSQWQAGTKINLEIDVFARYLDRLRPTEQD